MRAAGIFIAAAALAFSGGAGAQECVGIVGGLGAVYKPATGAGFLAVRAGPTASAAQLGELFNGDRIVIFDRRGNWCRIYVPGIGEAWASSRYIVNGCGF